MADEFANYFTGGSRVLIVGSSMGAGHMTAARVLAARVEELGGQAWVVDDLELPADPRGPLTRLFYRLMVTRAPWLYDAIMRAWMRHPGLFERLSAVGEEAYVRGLMRRVEAFAPDVVFSTYNLAGQMLGRLRRSGRLAVPVIAYVTDAGAHPYWVARGADMHLAPLGPTAERLRELGAHPVRVVEPLVPPAAGLTRMAARERLGLPQSEPMIIVNGGSWGVGAVVEAAACLGAVGLRVYVLCGNVRRLSVTVDALRNCHAVSWTDDVAQWIAAADAIVDSAGGTTCWEAIAAGRPVVLHRPLVGHGRLNAATLQDAGLATVTLDPDQLVKAVQRIVTHHEGAGMSDDKSLTQASVAAAI